MNIGYVLKHEFKICLLALFFCICQSVVMGSAQDVVNNEKVLKVNSFKEIKILMKGLTDGNVDFGNVSHLVLKIDVRKLNWLGEIEIGSFQNKNLGISIVGASKTRRTVLNAHGNNRHIVVKNDGRVVSLKNLVFLNGMSSSSGGGSIENIGNLERIENCVFSSNVAEHVGGGAIHNHGIIKTIKLSVFKKNKCGLGNPRTYLQGGAILNSGEMHTVHGSIFQDNTANRGGAVATLGNAGYITSCKFFGNTAESNFPEWDAGIYGGGLYIGKNGNARVALTYFKKNSSKMGGAIANFGKLSFKDSWFISNHANQIGSGGAVYNDAVIRSIRKSRFVGNKAYLGGGIFASSNSKIVSTKALKFDSNVAVMGENANSFYCESKTSCKWSKTVLAQT